MEFKNLLEYFIGKNIEFSNTCLGKISIMNCDIEKYLLENDEEYFESILDNNLKTVKAITYINKEGDFVIILGERYLSEDLDTIFHELTHVFDFKMFAYYKKDIVSQKLLDETFFIMWQEFHASYVAEKTVIGSFKDYGILKDGIQSAIMDNKKKFINLIQGETPNVNEVASFILRFSGKYIAWQETFPSEIPRCPNDILFDNRFYEVFRFLHKNRTFNKYIEKSEEFKAILKEFESKNI